MLTLAQQPDEIDLTCFRVSSLGSLTCYVGPMSFEWPSAASGGPVQSGHSLSQEDANDEHPENAHCTRPHLRWRRDSLHPPEVQRHRWDRNACAHIPDGGVRCVTWNTTENRNTSLLRGLLRIMMSFAFKKFTGRMNSSRLIRFLSLNSDSLAKKQEEGGNTVSFLRKKETAKTETIQKNTFFFEKERRVCEKEKRKKAEKG